jgi:hypothetical protein
VASQRLVSLRLTATALVLDELTFVLRLMKMMMDWPIMAAEVS